MKILITPLVVAFLFVLPQTAGAQDTAKKHSAFSPADIEWGPGPASLPPGAEAVVLQGNPAEKGPLTMRLKLPANYAVSPHMHPVIEHVTVLSGSINVGMGKKMDKKSAMNLPAGGFSVIPKDMPHFAFTTEPTVIQLHSTGPWGITYVNADDDPRNKTMGSN